MPYSVDDDNLPDYVKEKDPKHRRAWVKIWNSNYSRCIAQKMADKDGQPLTDVQKQACETRAFKIANALSRRLEMKNQGGAMNGLFYIDLSLLKLGKVFDAVVSGSFIDMLGRKVTFKESELNDYVKNTKDAIGATTTESGEIVGLPIDARGHEKGDGAGWIVDVILEDGRVRLTPKWTEIGQELIEKGIRRFFSPTVDTENKVILGGTLTNWPATRDEKGKILLRPIELERQDFLVVDEDQDFFKEVIEDDEGTGDLEPTSLREKLEEIIRTLQGLFKSPEIAELVDFDESAWDAAKATSGKEVEELRKICLLDLNGYPGQDEPIKGMLKLPYKYQPGGNPNKNAIKAIGGGARGMAMVKKPPDVPQDFFDRKMKSAANQVISWWKEAFDRVAPESIYRIAGKQRPAESSNMEVLEMDITKEELAALVSEQVRQTFVEMTTLPPPDEGAEGVEGNEPRFDMLRLFEMEGVSEEFRAAVKEQMLSYYDQQRGLLLEEAAKEIDKVKRESHVSEFCSRVTGGTDETPRGIATDPAELKKFILGLDPDQAKFIQNLLEKIVNGKGLVEFEEYGHGKKLQGTAPLPPSIVEKLNSKELAIEDLNDPLLGLGDVSQYDLSKWQK